MIIYKATNKINNKVYIGATNNLERRKREHRSHCKKDISPFHDDIIKFGFDAFDWEIIENCGQEWEDIEKKYIDIYRKLLGVDKVYNICIGGQGGVTHDISGENNPMYGKHRSYEEKLTISNKLKGKKKPEGFGEKISKKLKGIPKSPDAVAKKSHPVKLLNINTGETVYFPSKTAAEKSVHTNFSVLKDGKATKSGFILLEEGVEAIESIV